jgi:hypothetical protein
MNKTLVAATLVGTFMALQCLAAGFAMPSANDIAKAAEKPAAIASLLKGASPEQAAEVVKAVVSAILGLKLDAKEQTKRIAELVGAALKAIPAGQQAAFAESLGKAIGENPLLRGNAGVVSAIQGAIAVVNGNLAGVFGVAYSKAAGTGAIGTGLSDNTPSRTAPPVVTDWKEPAPSKPAPPAPPVAKPYKNQ